MLLSDFDFDLPDELIAQEPAHHREDSRLMVLDRSAGTTSSRNFRDIIDYFRPGDVLVRNDTRVIPARLLGRKESGGKIEVFLVRRVGGSAGETWLCLTKSSKPPRPGARLLFGPDLGAEVLSGGELPHRLIRFEAAGDFLAILERVGHIPLPPYIRRADSNQDRDRYQTVFATSPGAVAAPTAGLHFTQELFRRLEEGGVTVCSLTLHVGLGTFLPVRVDDVRHHRMHGEPFHIPDATAALVNSAKVEKRRVFALGTTSTRVLEYALDEEGRLRAGEGISDLFIYPGFEFRVVDGLVTNFHLPRSTLLMLVCAFAGRDLVLQSYNRAVAEKFRFFSYGDCTLIY